MHKSEHVHMHTKAFLRGLRTVMALHPHIAPPLQATTSKVCGGFWAQGFLAPWPRPISADGLHHPVPGNLDSYKFIEKAKQKCQSKPEFKI